MGKVGWSKKAGSVFLLWLGLAFALPAQTFTSLHSFDRGDGNNPFAGLTQGDDGNLYGATARGGANFSGEIFTITPAGALTRLDSFCSQANCTDGNQPDQTLVQGTDGNLYGTTIFGGATNFCLATLESGCGTVFKITPGGKRTTLYSFCQASDCPDGNEPSGLIQGADGNFYGTTFYGGLNLPICDAGCGTIFQITPDGALTTLYRFCSQTGCRDGQYPHAGLIQATNGKFYGTTANGGPNGYGTVFELRPSGMLKTLHTFTGMDGEYPEASLVQGLDGQFYGTTNAGGANRDGTVFSITAAGDLKTLHDFNGTDGYDTFAALIQGTDGNFYGATLEGGANNDGTLFSIIPAGMLTTLHSFDKADGAEPFAALVQDTNGTFYGTTYVGGANHDGTVFSLSVGLGPFVAMLPVAGTAGTPVTILGTDLAGATGVTFNGAAAIFTVISSSEITTTVPAGAATGTVQVVIPGGTLSSNVPFQVLP